MRCGGNASHIKPLVVSMARHNMDHYSRDSQLSTDNKQLTAHHNNHRNSLSARLAETAGMRQGPALGNSHRIHRSKADTAATNIVDGTDYVISVDASVVGSTTMADNVAIVADRTHFKQLKISSAESLQRLDIITSLQFAVVMHPLVSNSVMEAGLSVVDRSNAPSSDISDSGCLYGPDLFLPLCLRHLRTRRVHLLRDRDYHLFGLLTFRLYRYHQLSNLAMIVEAERSSGDTGLRHLHDLLHRLLLPSTTCSSANVYVYF